MEKLWQLVIFGLIDLVEVIKEGWLCIDTMELIGILWEMKLLCMVKVEIILVMDFL